MMMGKGFDILTIATTVVLHHPFIDMADVDILKTKWVSMNAHSQKLIDKLHSSLLGLYGMIQN